MASHMERISLFSFFIAAALFTSAVNAQQKYQAEHRFGRPITSPYRHLLSNKNPPDDLSKPQLSKSSPAKQLSPTTPPPSQPTTSPPSQPTTSPPPPPSQPTPSQPTIPPPSPPTPSQPTTPPPSQPTTPPPSQPTTSPPSPPTPPPPSPPTPPPAPSPPTPPPAPGKLPSPPREAEGDKKKSTGIIVGSLLACIAVFALIGVAIAWKYKKKQANVDSKQPGVWDHSVTTEQSSNDDRAFLLVEATAAYSKEAQETPAKAAKGTAGAKATSAANGSESHAAVDAPGKTVYRTALVDTATRHFTYKEILSITRNFSVVIGEGGSATVYYGQIQDGGPKVAVKKLKESGSQFGNLHAEIKILMRIHHRNLVSLVGLCEEEDKIVLVSEYMANGSLFDLLKARTGELTWRKRLQIALDAATGLEYLHAGCRPSIIHRDIKSTNILLDENLEAKLADFGLSKTGELDGSEFSSYHTKVAGTVGYIDPEYLYTQTLTKKSDVYSFGIVLFELITGKPAIVITETNEKLHISYWAMPMLMRGDIESLLDPLMRGHCNIESVWEVAAIARTATQQPSGRPDMTEIVSTLKSALRMETSWNTTSASEIITRQSSFSETPQNPVSR